MARVLARHTRSHHSPVHAALLVLAACHPYVAAGYEVMSHVQGPIAGLMTKPVVSAIVPIDRPQSADARTYVAAIGFGVPSFAIELGLQLHQISSDSFALPKYDVSYLDSPRYFTATTSLDFRWTWLRIHHICAFVHAGPALGWVLDKALADTTSGHGVRWGAGLALELPIVRVFLDASRTDVDVGGFNSLSGITLGLAIH